MTIGAELFHLKSLVEKMQQSFLLTQQFDKNILTEYVVITIISCKDIMIPSNQGKTIKRVDGTHYKIEIQFPYFSECFLLTHV